MTTGPTVPPIADARLTLQTLGMARLYRPAGGADQKAVLDGGKPLALVAFLASTPGRQARRDQLIDLLWADLEPNAAKHALRQTLWYIKKRGGEGILQTHGDVIAVSDLLVSDRDALLKAAGDNDHEAVITWYTGDFLPDFAAPGGAAFEGWADVERRRLRAFYLRAVDTCVRDLLDKGRVREAIGRARRGRDIDPLHQPSWRLLLEAMISGKEWTQAQLEADVLEQLIAAEDFELEPASRALIRIARNGETGLPDVNDTAAARTAELVGREHEFAVLLESIGQAQRGRGEHLHLRAAAGLGKSRLLNDALARLRAMRTRAVLVRCVVGSRELPYAAASDLALALGGLPGARGVSPDSASALVAMAPALSTYFSVPPDRSTLSEALRRRSQALLEMATAVSEEQAVVVLIDDVHWLDEDSRQLLSYLAARLDGMRLLLVTTGRPVVDGYAGVAGARVLQLSELSEPQCGAMVASIAPFGGREGTWDPIVHELRRTTGGSPLHVLETLQLLQERQLLVVAGGEWHVPSDAALFAALREGGALARRLEALSREERWILVLLSAAGAPIPHALLVDMAGGAVSAYADALVQVERRGFIARSGGDWVMAHDEMAAAVLDRAPAESRRAAHAALGRWYWQDAPTQAAQQRRAAQHLVQGGEDSLVQVLFRRFLLHMRSLGDVRSLRQLAEDLLGRHATPAVLHDLVDSVPWYVRMGLTSSRVVAATSLAMVLVTVFSAFAAVRAVIDSKPPTMAEVVVLHAEGREVRSHRVALLAGQWMPGAPIEVPEESDPTLAQAELTARFVELPQRPGAWLTSRGASDSGAVDLFIDAPDGSRRITYSRGDDVLGDVSPDGRFAVFTTARWNADSHYDLAVLDLSSGEVRRVTEGDYSDQSARWNHAGDRIAFSRRDWADDAISICLVNPDGSDLSCRDDWRGAESPVGWIDDQHLLLDRQLPGETSGRGELLVASLEDEGLQPLGERHHGMVNISPDGRWLVCACERIGYAEDTWFVMPIGRSAEARPLQLPVGVQPVQLVFGSTGRLPAIDSVAIETGLSAPVIGVAHQLSALGLSGDRVTGPLSRLRWRSRHPDVLALDSLTGVATPLQSGRAMVEVRVPGWTASTREVVVRERRDSLVLVERWDSTWTARWFTYGDPIPAVSRHGAQRVLEHRGDGSFESGVLSRTEYPVEDGVALDARITARIDRDQWQRTAVALVRSFPLESMTQQDRSTGRARFPTVQRDECGGRIPDGEGRTRAGRGGAWMGTEIANWPLETGEATGRLVTIRVQLFPDGRCGVAVDGRPMFLSRRSMELEGRVQLHLSGSAVGSDVHVAEVRVRQGVPDDIDWSRARRDDR